MIDFCHLKEGADFTSTCLKKPPRYRLKIWVTADVTAPYAWRCNIYLGKAGDVTEVVALEMTERLQGVTLTWQYFLHSFHFLRSWLKKKIALVGLRRNKPELPPKLVQIKDQPVLSSVLAFTKTMAAVSYIPKRGRNITFISKKRCQAEVRDGQKKKPVIDTD